MKLELLQDGTESFHVSMHEADKNAPVILFAVGAGGLPARYATLLETFINAGYTIIAPHFERLVAHRPSEEELTLRARRLSLALATFSTPDASIVGVGHSIGASTLLALAGAQMWLGIGQRIRITPNPRLSGLALLAPPTGFFQAPQALDAVSIPILIWVGAEDQITPTDQSEWLAKSLPESQLVELHVTDGAGHFSFMDVSPPNTVEPLANKFEFMQMCGRAIARFLADRRG